MENESHIAAQFLGALTAALMRQKGIDKAALSHDLIAILETIDETLLQSKYVKSALRLSGIASSEAGDEYLK